MRIISEAPLREFWKKYPDAEKALRHWISVTRQADWSSFADVRNDFRHADVYVKCTVFDVGGNKYRLITRIEYRLKIVFVTAILTHAEYDKNAWKVECR